MFFLIGSYEHGGWITLISGEELVYIYVAVWPDVVPDDQKERRKAHNKNK